MKWFKFYGQDYLSDPKILSLSASDRSCWVTLLSYGSVNDNGMIMFLDESQLMAQSGVSPMHEEWENTIGVLKKFESLKMIKIENNKITILNWKIRQNSSLTGYERVKKFRAKNKGLNDNKKNVINDNTKITSDKNRIDKNRIVSCPSKMDDTDFDTFWNSYPLKIGKKKVKDKFLKIPKDQLKNILKAVESYKQTKQWQNKQYIPHPITWLNQERWNDEIAPVKDNIPNEIKDLIVKHGVDIAMGRFHTKHGEQALLKYYHLFV